MLAAGTHVIVGLDVGTTGVKAVAFGLDSGWRQVALREYPLIQTTDEQAVQNPETVLTAIADALSECVQAAGEAEVIAVSVSAAMHGLIALDADLRPLTPLITWADSRAREEALILRKSGVQLHALSGTPVHPMTPLSKLLWVARHEPQTLAGARWWVGLKEYVLSWLTGKVVTELSSASATGLLDMRARSWSAAAIELAGVSVDQLPPILPTTARLPLSVAAAERTGLPAGTPVVVGAGDGPLGNLGTGAIEPGVAGLSLGTSGAVRLAVSEPDVDEDGALFCYALTDSVWVTGGAISNGGAVVRWAERSLAPDLSVGGAPADQALLELASTIPAGSEGLVMLPYLLSERAPLWSPALSGAYLGLRYEHTRAHLVRAALEGTCMQMRLILDRLDEVMPVRHVRATGGVFRSSLWREIMTAVLARPLQVIGEAEGTALGAAALGLFALERASTLSDAVALLADPAAGESPVLAADPKLVATYEQLRGRIPRQIRELQRIAAFYSGQAAQHDDTDDTVPRGRSTHRSEAPGGTA
ncbi:MAG: gluconokinase [Solirubrobacteraceae bacterium]